MELKELTDKTLELFNAKNTTELIESLNPDDQEKMKAFKNLVGDDLSIDWLQKIYQYYEADRKGNKQDFTPPTLARLIGSLALLDEKERVIDMCAGSGALTIQLWSLNRNLKFECLEFDAHVLPTLIYNLALRNIDAIVKQMDVLQNDVKAVFKINHTEKEFGEVIKQ